MTPERAKEIAGEHGCEFLKFARGVVITRTKSRYHWWESSVPFTILDQLSEPNFIAFYIPDERD